MRVEFNLNPNCSEAVFRFYTLEPKEIQYILQAIADEVYENNKCWDKAEIPLFKTAEEYEKQTLIYSCAGLGENESRVTIEKEKNAFVLNIGNNDISNNTTGWIEKIKKTGIKVQEAEYCEELKEKYARDCTCGITYFDGYKGLIKDKEIKS